MSEQDHEQDHDPDQDDRTAGVLVGTATGDALGAGYEFEVPPRGPVGMIGGGLGPFAPGEWTDDTAMAVAVAEVLATGRLDLPAIGERFLAWYRADPPDAGNLTRAVLGPARSGAELPLIAARVFAERPRGAAGNGALMRTAAVALAHPGDLEGLAVTARAVAELTHADPLAGDACVLWCVAIDRARHQDRLDGVHDGLELLPPARRARWREWLLEAETAPSARFTPNGFTVTALQAAYAAVCQTPIPAGAPGDHLAAALVAAVRIGDDTDTVAAIAGGLLGARWGAGAIPPVWREVLHGWPGLDADGLTALALRVARTAPGPRR